MDITKFFSKKCPLEKSDDDKDEVPPPKSTDQGAEGQSTNHLKTKSDSLSKAGKKFVYKCRLSYKKDWEKIYPWVYCTDPKFCRVCQSFGRPSATARGTCNWTVKGVTDWNHATEMLKQHNSSKGHKDGANSARMAEQAKETGTVVDLQLAASAKQAEPQRQMNRAVLLKLLRLI